MKIEKAGQALFLAVILTVFAALTPSAASPPAAGPSGAGYVSLDSVIKEAELRRPGKFIEAELEETNGTMVYEIEILGLDNVIYKLKFSAKTGAFLGEEAD